MKILERIPWSLIVTCPHCRSRLEIEDGDVYRGEVHIRDEMDIVYYSVCPVCQGDIDHGDYYHTDKIPNHIKDRALKK